MSFRQPWLYYKAGFGSVNENHWLGNERLFLLTSLRPKTLLVMFTVHDKEFKANYKYFHVGNETSSYRLSIGEFTGGNAGEFNEPPRTDQHRACDAVNTAS